MKTLNIGTRGSKLALKQAEIVSEQIKNRLNYNCNIKIIHSLGDQDQISQLHSFKGQGVFTKTLESALLNDEVDLVVHSLKDMPIEDTPNLEIRSVLERQRFTDTLLIRKENLITESPIEIKPLTRIASGSIRRQNQLYNEFDDISIVDIRGNVNTRIGKLSDGYFDGLIMASAVFDRITLEIPEDIISIELPYDRFPTTPGQGAIAIQTKVGNLKELEILNHQETFDAVKNERKLLDLFGGGCDEGVGLNIYKKNNEWYLVATYLLEENNNELYCQYYFNADTIDELISIFKKRARFPKELFNPVFKDKKILLIKESQNEYEQFFEKNEATVISIPIFTFQTQLHELKSETTKLKWKEVDWVVLTSQRAIEFLSLLTKVYPRKSFRVAVVGQKTARAVRKLGLPVHLIANGNVNDLQYQLKKMRKVYPGKVLFLRGERITAKPSDDADEIIAYKTIINSIEIPLEPDMVIVFSKRTAEILMENQDLKKAKWITSGTATIEYLRNHNCDVVELENYSVKSLVDIRI